jgi:hypothetical protein
MSVNIIGIDGSIHVQVFDETPDLKQLQDMVGGYIEIVRLSDGRQLVVNEDGLSLELPVNHVASTLAGCLIVGPAVLLNEEHLMT